MKFTAALFAVAGALATLVWWAAAGASLLTLNQTLKTVTSKDEFGELVTKDVWVAGFVPGLVDLAAPVAGGLIGVALVLGYLSRKDIFDAPELGAR